MNQCEKDYLLQISIGPVQDFIAAARRTKDLWMGSHMLSEISKAAALAVYSGGGELIFPSAETIKAAEKLKKEPQLNVANVILAQVKGTHESLDVLATRAHQAAKDRFKEYAQEAYEKAKKYICKERWDRQIEDVIEFYAAWTPVRDNYKKARQDVARLLAARKNLRDFKPHLGEAKVPKSSLDGLRESVFLNGDITPKIPGARLKKGEALDAVGLIKRLAEDKFFPAVSRVAVDPWVRGRGQSTVTNPALLSACEELVRIGALSRVYGENYCKFPYEGTALQPSRYPAMQSECDDEGVAKLNCKQIKDILANEPKIDEPYFALLVADGDRMGKAISSQDSIKRHQTFSAALARFAGEAQEIIRRQQGACVYTGGDDVLAFLPLDRALPCARELHNTFEKLLKDYSAPTLSVGISIAHAMEDLEFLLNFGRDAESIAKKGLDGQVKEQSLERNGLAVVVRSRGNSAVAVREQWQGKKETDELALMSLDARLEWWANRFIHDEIPVKFPYELRENIKFYKNWTVNDSLKSALERDMRRIFNRKDVNLSLSEKKRIDDYIVKRMTTHQDIEKLSNELLIAQQIASGIKQAQPVRKECSK